MGLQWEGHSTSSGPQGSCLSLLVTQTLLADEWRRKFIGQGLPLRKQR